MTRVEILLAATLCGWSAPALAQHDHSADQEQAAPAAQPASSVDHSDHAGHTMPADEPAQTVDHSDHTGHTVPAAQPAPAMDHSAHRLHETPMQPDAAPVDHSAHGGHGHGQVQAETIGNAPPPPVPTDHAADAIFGAARMAPSRRALAKESAFQGAVLMVDRLEYRSLAGRDGYAWDGAGWIGSETDRFVLASEGEGRLGEDVDHAELRGSWWHAIDPFWNLEIGARQDIGHGPDRTYAMVGVEGLAPYWLEAGVHAFVSNKGDVHLRAEVEHDMRLTQRLVLQPAIELDAALQDVPELAIGAGLEKIELGARLRYEIAREFAPYVGLHWERKLGTTARWARAAGEGASDLSLVGGVRFWF